MKLPIRWAVALIVSIFITGCEAAPSQGTVVPTAPAAPATLLMPTHIPATATQAAAPTSMPTVTFVPTTPPQPTQSATPAPAPVKLSGKGDEVLDLNKWNGAAIAHITFKGSGSFSVLTVDGTGSQVKQLVTATGDYDGYRPIDFVDGSVTKRLQMKANGGSWTVELIPMVVSQLNQVGAPGTYQGKGDDVVIINGSADTAAFNYPGSGSFSVWSYSSTLNSVINVTGPYQGQIQLDPGTLILEVVAKGPWSVSVTAK